VLNITTIIGAAEAERYVTHKHVAIVIDVLRCTSTIVFALQHGYQRIVPVRSLEGISEGTIAAETDGRQCQKSTFNNSPSQILAHPVLSEKLILCSTNGTPSLLACQQAYQVLVGSLLNAKAVAAAAVAIASQAGRSIVLVASGYHGEAEQEDLLAAEIITSYCRDPLVDEQAFKPAIAALFHGRAASSLRSKGFADDVQLCCQLNQVPIVPVLEQGIIFSLR